MIKNSQLSVSLVCVGCLVVVLFTTINAFGWNRRGHMMAAAVAYSDLNKNDTATRDKILEILRLHPAYNSWKTEYTNGGTNISKYFTLDAYIFMRAAVWPDDIRDTKEHKATWHYVNYPVRLPDEVDFGTVKPKINIFDGYKKAVNDIEDAAVSKRNRAKMVSWVFHLIGDIHQPLHSVAMHSAEFPNGDSGGNSQCIRPGQDTTTNALHSYWDGLMGYHAVAIWDGRAAWQDNVFYSSFHSDLKASDFNNAPNIESWAKESARLALPNAYTFNGSPLALKRTVEVNGRWRCPKMPDSAIAPPNYGKDSKHLASRRLVMAGYRLSNALRKLTS